MDEILADLSAQHAELDALLGGLTPSGWSRPTPCEGWDVTDVVIHLAQTDEMARGSAEGRFAEVASKLSEGLPAASSVDEGVELMVRAERGASPVEVLGRWRTSAAALVEALGRHDPADRLEWVMGDMAARSLATTRLSETWIHTTDVAAALGVELAPADRLRHIARLAWRTLPYAFSSAGRTMSGPVAFELVGPHGDRWDHVPDESPTTVVRGPAIDLCLVAGRRADPATTALTGEGPDLDAVLELVRTYA